jgi:N-acetylated-alpha-linked acidic dipeptidase
MEEYYVLQTIPKKNSIEIFLNETIIHTASIYEDAIQTDEYTKNTNDVPNYFPSSLNGTYKGDLFYINYGRKEDYQKLISLGINLKGL